MLFLVSLYSAVKEVDEILNRKIITVGRNEDFSVRGEEHIIWLGIYVESLSCDI